MALIIAAIVFVLTLAWCAVVVFANGMSDAPSQSGISVAGPFLTGTIIAALIAASHWMPHISW